MPTSDDVGQIYAKSGPAAHEVCCAYSMVGETTIHEFSFDFEGNIWFMVWTLTEPPNAMLTNFKWRQPADIDQKLVGLRKRGYIVEWAEGWGPEIRKFKKCVGIARAECIGCENLNVE